jgi:lipopolysaccharide biosynthesis glycosyltransferase
MSPTFKIAVCHHRPGAYFSNQVFEPIHAGRALAKFPLPGMAGDDTGRNVSERNPFWSELSVLYWMRHNWSADYLGLLHYRRLFNFSTAALDRRYFTDCSAATIARFGWTPEHVADFCAGHDAVTTMRILGQIPGHAEPATVYDMYCHCHFRDDIDKTIAIVKSRSPDLYPFLLKSLASQTWFHGNLLILREDIFHVYADWLFDLLFEIEKAIDVSAYSSYQRRACAFLGERLTNAYLQYLIANGVRHRSAGVAFGVPEYRFDQRSAIERIAKGRKAQDKLRSPERIHVALATDATFLPHCGTAVASLLDNVHRQQDISIHIVHDGSLSPADRETLSSLAADRGDVQFRFYTIDPAACAPFPHGQGPVTAAVYLRLYAFSLLDRSIAKVICLNADVLVTDNIAELWSLDLEGAVVGGCPDEGGGQEARRLRLAETHSYFNAGVLVFDLQKLRAMAPETLYLESFVHNTAIIAFGDQDILNIALVGRTKRLPLRWNVTARIYDVNPRDHTFSDEEAAQARAHPAIVHFTQANKPWMETSRHPLRDLYWMWRDTTPWAVSRSERWQKRMHTRIRDAERRVRHWRYRVTGRARESE